MGDVGDDMKALRAMKQERHARWRMTNLEIIRNSGFKCLEREAAILFRESGYPHCDFYPDTGRWVEVKKPKVYSGGAARFLSWYESHKGARR